MRKYFFLFIFIGTLLMIVVMQHTGASLKTVTTPYGILDIEFANTVSRANEVIDSWEKTGNPDNIQVAKLNTELDFIFLLFYSIFLSMSCRSVAVLYTGIAGTLGLIASFGAIAAGVLDILENAGILLMLHGHIYPWVTLLTFAVSVTKWVLALMAVLYLVIGGGAYLIRQFIYAKRMRRG